MFDALLTPEEKGILAEARAFARSVDPQLLREMDAEKVRYPREFVQAAAERGLLGMRFEPRWGGRGASWVAELAAIEEVGTLGAALGCLFSLPSIIGEALARYGTDEQRERWLAPVLRGDMTCAEALTEPRGGSDFFGATTTARRDGDHYVLHGQKRFVVGAEGADLFLVYAKTAPEAAAHASLSVFLVERGWGVQVEHVYGLLGARGGGTGRIVFRDIEVPLWSRIGPEHAGGDIFNRMMVPERLTSAAGALGLGRAAIEVAARYSQRRKAFGQLIARFEAVSFKVADAVTALDAARALAWVAGRTADSGADARRLVSEAKRTATEAGWTAVNHAMQVLGGIGYTGVYPVERLMRDARLALIWTGSNEIMNLLVQHEYYKELAKRGTPGRDVEADAVTADGAAEKVFE